MKILLPNIQYIFGTLAKATKFSESSAATYFAKFLVRDKATIKKIEDTIKAVAQEKWKTVPKLMEDFTFDVDTDKYPDQEGGIIINAKNTTKPKLFNRQQQVIDAEDNIIYRGCFVNVSISAWAFTWQGKKGVSANLHGLQFYKDGEPMGAAVSTPDDFEKFDDNDDDYDDSQEALLGSPLG